MAAMISVEGLSKTFTLHTQGGARIPVFENLDFKVAAGECVALHGPSGAGKSTLLRSLYANYKPDAGRILIRHGDTEVDMASAVARDVLEVRKRTIGYVSQFLRVIPRVPAIDIVEEPARIASQNPEHARHQAQTLLDRLRIPEELWGVAPATFSGGEQQRVNIARTFVYAYPILLLDEPTAALDAANRQTVVELIQEAKDRGAAVVGIFHDQEVREAVADRLFQLEAHKRAA